jgi:hypothetical protein
VSRSWVAPLIAIGVIVAVVLSFVLSGEPPEADSGATEIVEHYVDNKDSVIAGAVFANLAALLVVFFANLLRRTLSAAGDPTWSATVLVGAGVLAVAIAIDATISVALAESAEDVEPSAVQALQALWDNDFLPFILGTLIFLISAGVSTLRSGAFPRWLGWVALALALIGFTPIGWIAGLGAALWIVVVAVLMARAPLPAAGQPPPRG